ncbi:GntR family transcriptional regulator [Corynebacterium striatum]|uniref:GntR family transcriptional regulator n=1 Tax=Corynebacterium striatum TaxID=43770 RepID=A0A2Z2J9K2_CORST|nr:GntR family transcriptional regulator [Corynebacterium striatum]ART21928.1 GntR family transcriptional regulator [Corynebacterium striatum]
MSDTRPIYQQLAGGIRDMIINGELPEGGRAPSTNELSAFHSVNPTTSAKALTVLFEEGLLEKRRGLGMFVCEGAREKVRHQRHEALREDFILPLLKEGAALGLSASDIADLIEAEGDHHDAP